MRERYRASFGVLVLLVAAIVSVHAADPKPTQPVLVSGTNLAQLVIMIRGKAKILESSSGMRLGFQSFTAAYKIPPKSVSYSDFVLVRLLYEATRDAGFWNMHWDITDQPPNSDRIWSQWRSVSQPSLLNPTATAECDELSALYSFLVERAGVKGMGLFWPTFSITPIHWPRHFSS